MFKREHKASYNQELAVYRTLSAEGLCSHDNILHLLSHHEYDGTFLLVLEYHPGSLYDHLKEKVISLDQFFDIAMSSAAGNSAL